MKVRLKLKPGQRGTKQWQKLYGDKLVCVRYRYDEASKKRYTTVEIIADEEPWEPFAPTTQSLVLVKIAFKEKKLQQQIASNGGIWSKSKKLWQVPYQNVVKLGLEKRIVVKASKKFQESG